MTEDDDRPVTEPEGTLWELDGSNQYRPVWQIEGMPETVEEILRAHWLEPPPMIDIEEVRKALRAATGSDRMPEYARPPGAEDDVLWMRLAHLDMDANAWNGTDPPAWWRTDNSAKEDVSKWLEAVKNYSRIGRVNELADTVLFPGGIKDAAKYEKAYGELVNILSFVIQDRRRHWEREDLTRSPLDVLIEQGVRYFVSLRMAEALRSPAAPFLRRLRPIAELALDGYGSLALLAGQGGTQVELRLPVWDILQRPEIRDTGAGAPIRVATLENGEWTPLHEQ